MNIFLDLDGTLTDPFEGITKSVAYALERLGHDVPSREDLAWTIGPALVDSFARLGVASPQEALGLYRQRYTDIGLFENLLYPGVLDMLHDLKVQGHALYLMTAKPHAYAKKITAHFGIAPFLANEFGPELDGTRNDKGELLAFALKQLNVDADKSVMVGDRSHDFNAAARNGMRSIAVRWGYGDQSEWALADLQCDEVGKLSSLIAAMA